MSSQTTSSTVPASAVAPQPGRRRRSVYPPLLVLLSAGVALRVLAMVLYQPAVMTSYDEPRFARAGPTGLFDDFWMPAGYPAFLKVLRHVSDHVWFTIAVQHLLGIAVGLLLYAALRRLGTPRGLACVPAGVALLSGDHLFLEHQLMTDAFLIVVAAAALACAVRGLVPTPDRRWLAAAGALAAAAALVRSPGVVLVAVVLVCAVVWAGAGGRRRAGAGLAVAVGAVVIFGAYFGADAIKNGRYAGLTDMSGWNLYSRVAPFADCGDFTPPPGTRALCERTPPAQRQGPFYYVWNPNSVSRRTFTPLGPQTGGRLGAFARAAILHQPGDYLAAVATDLARYVEPDVGRDRGYSGQGRDLVSFGYRDAGVEQAVERALSPRYEGTTVHASGAEFLADYQDLMRVDRLWLLAAVVLTFVGAWAARGAVRLGVWLFGLSALGLYVLPVLTVSYDFRYGIPPETFIVASGSLGALALVRRIRTARHA